MMFHSAESAILSTVQWIRLCAEGLGVLTIAVGLFTTLLLIAKLALRRQPVNFNLVRLSFARYLALALEFQLGADILSTAINPTWDELKILAGIAIIRTALNFFLTKEMSEEAPKAETKALNASKPTTQDA